MPGPAQPKAIAFFFFSLPHRFSSMFILSMNTDLQGGDAISLRNDNLDVYIEPLFNINRTGTHVPKTNLFTGPGKIKRRLCVCLAVKNQSPVETRKKSEGKIVHRKGYGGHVLSEGRDEDEKYGPICPGCGVFMQDKDPNLPGYYKKREEVTERGALGDEEGVEDDDLGELEEAEVEEEDEEFLNELEDEFEEGGELSEGDEKFEWESDEWEKEFLGEDDDLEELDAFAPAGVGYGNITEENVKDKMRIKLPKAERKRLAREAQKEKEKVTVCARCHSLRNYGRVKNQAAENLIPDFDFDRLITTRMMKPTGNANSTIIVMVVDCVDFDGSFPKRVVNSLSKALEGVKNDPKLSKKLPKLVLVATKVDLLPSQISPARLDRWVRHRAKAAGVPKLSGVYLVSAQKDLGVRNLLSFIKELAGPRGNVWVIGAQNAGKSTLINAMGKKGGAKMSKLTEAPIPGTTLGILRIGGILSAKAKMYDTPGLLHPYLLCSCLVCSKVGQAVHVGGLVRLDLNEASIETIYVTVLASPNVSLHLGKIENADEIWRNHVGMRLQPPMGQERASELGEWEAKEIKVSGTSWDVNSVDIAVAGLGWFSLGLKGEATLTLWTFSGIEITEREPLVLDRAAFLERPGFWLPKAISDAIGNQTKQEARSKKKIEEERDYLISEISL
ncbi:hypothetical protein CRG98_037510 [Punica granatum]|uniref:CP-type G domain-containing protein n=1 Tax=Punica granatum TaxID=22663 RepID=A0A2I0IDI3_PUNGR|nr:hypothetical protein CRG98_037510 [Punica granatum]